MIESIIGTIISLSEKSAVVQTGPLALSVFCSSHTLSSLETGKNIRLFTYLQVREDGFFLFGFSTESERILFLQLISISGIGPKAALEILTLGENRVRKAINDGDAVFLASAKGIGKKIAERVTLELKGKVETPMEDGKEYSSHSQTHSLSEAMSALEGLGWKKSDIAPILSRIPEDLKETEQIIKWFLTNK